MLLIAALVAFFLSGGVLEALSRLAHIEGWLWIIAAVAAGLCVYLCRRHILAWGVTVAVLTGGCLITAMVRGGTWLVSGAVILVVTLAVMTGAGYLWGWALFRKTGVTNVERTVLGLGVFGTFQFILGVTGLFYPWLVGATAVMSAIGGLVVRIVSRDEPTNRTSGADNAYSETLGPEPGRVTSLLLGIAAIMAVLTLLYAVLPHVQGAQDDYDVLEYHLQLPREYLEHHRVAVLSHNLFSALPQLAEMIFAPAMVTGSAVSRFLPTGESYIRYGEQVGAKAVNVLFLALLLLILVEEGHRRHGKSPWSVFAAAAVLLPLWTVLLAGGAMVEMPLATFGVTAVVIILRWAESLPAGEEGMSSDSLRLLAAGAAAVGMTAAVKYSGIAYFGVPLAAAAAAVVVWKRQRKVFGVAAGAAALPIIPWMAFSHIYTGNPFHPLLLRFFDEHALSTLTAHRWQSGMAAQTSVTDAIVRTLADAAGVWPGDVRLGPYAIVTVILALTAILAGIKAVTGAQASAISEVDGRRTRLRGWLVIGVVVWGSMCWLLFSNRLERFLYPVVTVAALLWLEVPLVFGMLSLSVRWLWIPVCTLLISAPLTCGAAFSQRALTSALSASTPEVYVRGINQSFEVIEDAACSDGVLLLLGESEAFYARSPVLYSTPYDRSPLADMLEDSTGVQSALDKAGINAVYVDETELARTKKRYRPTEESLMQDVPNTQGRTFAQFLEKNWVLAKRYNGPPGRSIFLYIRRTDRKDDNKK
jgi:hypothetical protein